MLMQLLATIFISVAVIALIVALYYLLEAIRSEKTRSMLFSALSNFIAISAAQLFVMFRWPEPPLPGTFFSSSLACFIAALVVLIFISLLLVAGLTIKKKTLSLYIKIITILLIVWFAGRLLIVLINIATTWWFVNYEVSDKSFTQFVRANDIPVRCPNASVLIKINAKTQVELLCLSGNGLFPRIDVFEKPPLISYKLYSTQQIRQFNKLNSEWALPQEEKIVPHIQPKQKLPKIRKISHNPPTVY